MPSFRSPQRRFVHRFAAAICCAAATCLSQPSFAQAAGQWTGPQQAYAATCAYCHDTEVAPALLGRRLATEYVVLVVQRGQRAMPAFRPTDFTAAELSMLAQWIHASGAPAQAGGNASDLR